MRRTAWTRIVLGLAVTALALAAMLWVVAWLFQPDLTPQPPVPPEEVAAAVKARDVSFDPSDPSQLPVNYVDVDYSAAQAPWRPKGESPILAELVREGRLPPVAERVPQEPVVLKGCDGIGRYGGTWLRIATTDSDISVVSWRLSMASLVRWSPLGYPIVPHVAKRVEASQDKRVWTITLRRGTKWSDGQPLSADDIMYWWEQDTLDTEVSGRVHDWMLASGQAPTLEKVDGLTVRFTFPVPNGLFLEQLAIYGNNPVNSPAHYLRQYHPTVGDEAVCKAAMSAYKLPSRRALYTFIRDYRNPECPRLWPWVYRSYKAVPPQVFVRNPYFFAVDTEGNQLPYVDRLQFDVMDNKMLTLSAANGMVTMQERHIRYQDYTTYMARRKEQGTRVLFWYPATRSMYVINPNNLRRVDPARPETKWKAQLLADKRFRQALSVAIDRKSIIKAEYNDQVEPAQVSPGVESPFHNARLHKVFTQHDPDLANVMLDDLGLTKRDIEGFRTFPDGTYMAFYIDFCAYTGVGPLQFVMDDWAKVGVRSIPRERSRALFYNEKDAMEFDFNVWDAASDFLPLCCPRYFVAHHTESFYAVGWGRWYMRGGLFNPDNPDVQVRGCIPPPPGHPMRRSMEVLDAACRAPTLEEQVRIFNEALEIAADNLWTINLTSPPPQLVIVREGFRNVPPNALAGHVFSTPGNAGMETYYFEDAKDSPGAIAETKDAVMRVTPRPGAAAAKPAEPGGAGRSVGAIVRWMVIGVGLALAALAAVKHPYFARRLAIMVPTLLVISVVVFVIIQLPPGDYLTTRIMQLQESGDAADLKIIEDLKTQFFFEDTAVVRYARWMGLYWFTSLDWERGRSGGGYFDGSQEGLLQGNMGRSMETTQEVNEIVGDRILLTVLISLGTMMFTWAVAIPIGIYSAVRQYSLMDYVLTFAGFIGMCVPAFLLALVLMAMADVSGLFSAEFAAQPEWTWGKFADLLKHVWIPVVVMGVGGTAAMIRVMRANLLDELKKPYVITAMAKGVRPMRLLLKYPVRLALNPFVSGIGGLFPQLVSGGAIVAVVLSLPTVGPLMMQALFSEDMFLAGSMLMVLSLLGVLGTLVSDLLLLWLDPRIRFQGGTR